MIISLKSSKSGSSRGLVHYLAHSKLDREKEGERREFFNEENELNVAAANHKLSVDGAKPKSEELLHIVVAPSKEEIERVGNDAEARRDALKAVARAVVAQLQKSVKARKLKWAGTIHLNTDLPHAHLAIQKRFLNETESLENLHIKRELLFHNERDERGEKRLYKGDLIVAAENKIAELSKRRERETESGARAVEAEPLIERNKSQAKAARDKTFVSGEATKISNFNERRILAEEMLVAAEIAVRERNIENLLEHGDKKRFKIKDAATGRTRHVSLFDIERRIEVSSRREARAAQPHDLAARENSVKEITAKKHAEQSENTGQLEKILQHVLGAENRRLHQAQEKHVALHNQKLLLEKRCEKAGVPLPPPIFKYDEIQQLQTAAIKDRDLEKTLSLEAIRQINAAELDRPARRDRDVAEFLAVERVGKLRVEAAEKRFDESQRNRQLRRVLIVNRRWSHRELELHEQTANRQPELWRRIAATAKRIVHSGAAKNCEHEKLDYPALHKAVDRALETENDAQSQEIEQQKTFDRALEQILAAEINPRKNRIAPVFTAHELAEIEDLSSEVGKENVYETVLLEQEKWLCKKLEQKLIISPEPSDAARRQNHSDSKAERTKGFELLTDSPNQSQKVIGETLTARAAARQILADARTADAREKLDKYLEEKRWIKHSVINPLNKVEVELSLHQVEPKKRYYLLDSLVERALESKEQKELRRAVEHAAARREKELVAAFKKAQNQNANLKTQKSLLVEKYKVTHDVQPIFAPKEIAALEIRKCQTKDRAEAIRLEKIIAAAETDNRVERVGNLLDATAKILNQLNQNQTRNRFAEVAAAQDLRPPERDVDREQSSRSDAESADAAIRELEPNSTPEKNVNKEKGRDR